MKPTIIQKTNNDIKQFFVQTRNNIDIFPATFFVMMMWLMLYVAGMYLYAQHFGQLDNVESIVAITGLVVSCIYICVLFSNFLSKHR